MDKKSAKCDSYPWLRIIPRWLFGIAEIGLSIYLVLLFNANLGLIFGAFWAFSLFVMLPFIRCSRCYYYGKRCNTGWGLIAGFAFPKSDPIYFQAGYGLTIFLWPLRILPIGLGILYLRTGITFNPDGLFGIYLAVLILHRLYCRIVSCPICHQKDVCPVYNPRVLAKKSAVRL